jgi:hypothetical protein
MNEAVPFLQVLRTFDGQDVTEVFNGGSGWHSHSSGARSLLAQFRVGGGTESRPSPALEAAQPGIDLEKPILRQVRESQFYSSITHSSDMLTQGS